jgi:hypothetical protein
MMTHDVQDNQLISEEQTAENKINVDCANGGSLLFSDYDNSFFQPNADGDPSEDDARQTIAAEIRPACNWGWMMR